MSKLKIQKSLRDLNAFIDGDRQKLCDRIHGLELSHKRMEKLLRRTFDYIDSLGWVESDNGDCTSLYESIVCELERKVL